MGILVDNMYLSDIKEYIVDHDREIYTILSYIIFQLIQSYKSKEIKFLLAMVALLYLLLLKMLIY